MPLNKKAEELFKGFSRLDKETRLSRLVQMGALTKEEVEFLENGGGKVSHFSGKID